jgi:glycosyltransferase involved in cell wall biosynthesis
MIRSKTKKRQKPIKLALCIPCHTEDLACIDTCFKSIKNQEQQPDFIVMAVSNSTPEKEAIFNQKKAEYALPIEYQFSADAHLPGGNRNRAAAAAIKRGATHLSFFDADDSMHPARLKIIRRAFKKNPNLSGIVHGFSTGAKTESTTTLPWENVKGVVHLNRLHPKVENNQEGIEFTTVMIIPKNSNGSENIHNGHSSVTSRFWKKFPFREDLKTGEDGSFVSTILKRGQLGYIPDPLTLYMK